MDLKKSFSFTFTIPAFKKVYYDKKRRPYGSLSPKQQYVLLENIMCNIINPLHFEFIDWVYEKHEDGRLHIHGYVITTPENDDKIFILRDSFYSYNQKINLKMSSYLKISDIQKLYMIYHFGITIYKNIKMKSFSKMDIHKNKSFLKALITG